MWYEFRCVCWRYFPPLGFVLKIAIIVCTWFMPYILYNKHLYWNIFSNFCFSYCFQVKSFWYCICDVMDNVFAWMVMWVVSPNFNCSEGQHIVEYYFNKNNVLHCNSFKSYIFFQINMCIPWFLCTQNMFVS